MKRGPKPTPKEDLTAKLIAATKLNDRGCWEWQRAVLKSGGYGAINWRGRVWRAHRLSFAAFHRPVRAGEVVCHRCDNPRCINPDHLFCGTPADNVADMMVKGRHFAPGVRGESHPAAKLTAVDVAEIRRRFAEREPRKNIARSFRVSVGHIFSICRRETWRHLTTAGALNPSAISNQ